MHSSWAVLRKPRSSIIFTFSAKTYRPFFKQANKNSSAPLVSLSNLCGGGGWHNRYKYSGNDKSNDVNCSYFSWFLRSVCLGVVVGSSSNSCIAYADDSQQQYADAAVKKPMFLFGGNMHAYLN